MDIDIDLAAVVQELLEQNKNLTLENIILKKALEAQSSAPNPPEEAGV